MSNKKRILVVEDEPAVASQIAQRLTNSGYLAEVTGNGLDAIDIIVKRTPDLVILDIMLPGTDGFEVARVTDKLEKPPSIIILTARDDEVDHLTGYSAGADYYLTKPFSPRVLLATVDAAFRHISRLHKEEDQPGPDQIQIGGLLIDHKHHRVFLDQKERHLTPTEFQLLELMVHRRGEVLSRQLLLEEVWDWIGDASDTRTVDAHVRSLRSKLQDDLIRTVHGVGYSFDPPYS